MSVNLSVLDKNSQFKYLYDINYFLDRNNNENIFKYTLRNGYLDVIRYLAFIDNNLVKYYDFAFLSACTNGHLKIAKYIKFISADNYENYDDVFKKSCENNHLEIVKYLVLLGINLNLYIKYAREVSTGKGYLEIFKYLNFIIIDIPKTNYLFVGSANIEHLKIIKYCIFLDITVNKASLSLWACIYGQLEIVSYLLSFDRDYSNYINTMIIFASKYGYLGFVKYLSFIYVGILDKNVILEYAAKNGHLKIIKYLIFQGVDIKAKDNYTIRKAVKNNRYNIVKYLTPLITDISEAYFSNINLD